MVFKKLLIFLAILGTLKIQSLSGAQNKDLEWWKKAIIYQVYPRSFQDSDNDGTGDLQGVISRLGYLKSIGVSAIWLNPIYPSGGEDNGYDVSDYYSIDPVYGTMDDFDQLVKEAHEMGIYIIMDIVPNHTSDKHQWFIESSKNNSDDNPYRDYYVWHDSTDASKPPNNWLSIFGGSAWKWHPDRGQWYLHSFLAEQPDLNFRNPEVQQEMKKIIKFWLQEKNTDGIRVDALANLVEDAEFRDEPIRDDPSVDPKNLIHADLNHIYTQHLKETFENLVSWRQLSEEIQAATNMSKMIVTEVYDDMKIVMKYCNYNGQPAANFPFNFQLVGLRNGVNPQTKAKGVPFKPGPLKSLIDPWYDNLLADCWSNWVIGNHDNSRIGTRIGAKNIDLANTLNLLLGGASVTYYGEEIGMVDLARDKIAFEDCQDEFGKRQGPQGFAALSRDYERTPMQWNNSTKNAGFTAESVKPWLPVNENYLKLNVENQERKKFSHLWIYKKLADLKQKPSFLYGSFDYVLVDDNIFSFQRQTEGKKSYIVVMNLGQKSQSNVNLRSKAKSIPKKAKVELSFGKSLSESQELEKKLPKNGLISTEKLSLKPGNCFILSY